MFRLFPTGSETGCRTIALYNALVIIDYLSFKDNTLKIIDYLLFLDNALKIRVFHDHFVTVKQI